MPDASPYASTQQWMLGEFRVDGVLGEGGSGSVYAATFRGGEVALKVLRADLALSDRERKRFLVEAERMQRVGHVGLVALLGAGVLPDGRPYICMPRLSGETLTSRLAQGRLPLETALVIFDVLAEAVGALHRAGLIHRDIKPENVFLAGRVDPSRVPHPILLDFGIARDVTEGDSTTTVAGQLRGTPAYMAPERFFGSPANVRSDVYELAVTLYMMLVGRKPWDEAHGAAARLSPMHPRDAGVDLPADLVTVMLRALSTRPEVRPDSATELARAIRDAAAAPAVAERTSTAVLATSPPEAAAIPAMDPADSAMPRRRRVLPWALAVVVVTGLGVGALVQAQSHSSGAAPGEATEAAPVLASAASALPTESSHTTTDDGLTPQSPPTSSVVLEEPASSRAARPSLPRTGAGIRPTAHGSPASPPAASSVPASAERYYLDRK